MTGIAYGNYALGAGMLKYQTANSSKKSSGNADFGTKVSGRTSSGVSEKYGNYTKLDKVDQVPSKYEVKDGRAISLHYRYPGIEYKYMHAAESTEENPVLIVRGMDQYGKVFEEKIDVRQIDPYHTTQLEIGALSYFNPGEYKTIPLPQECDGMGMQDRFDYITLRRRDIEDCKRFHFTDTAAWLKDCIDFMLDFTKNRARTDRQKSDYRVNEDLPGNLVKENEKNLELYSSAARERMIYSMSRKCTEELSDMLWEK